MSVSVKFKVELKEDRMWNGTGRLKKTKNRNVSNFILHTGD